ncbi:hypothetical protein [Thomasclavelia cocleata]|nr:hypothetical protein [Thomasclavelia cocleata]
MAEVLANNIEEIKASKILDKLGLKENSFEEIYLEILLLMDKWHYN